MPSGVWHEEEYEKLPKFDRPTGEQPPGAFFCHQQTGRLCAGWVGCHDMDESLGLRFCHALGILNDEDVDAALDYQCPIPLWDSGAEAAEHGRREILRPGARARRALDRLGRKLEGKSTPKGKEATDETVRRKR